MQVYVCVQCVYVYNFPCIISMHRAVTLLLNGKQFLLDVSYIPLIVLIEMCVHIYMSCTH